MTVFRCLGYKGELCYLIFLRCVTAHVWVAVVTMTRRMIRSEDDGTNFVPGLYRNRLRGDSKRTTRCRVRGEVADFGHLWTRGIRGDAIRTVQDLNKINKLINKYQFQRKRMRSSMLELCFHHHPHSRINHRRFLFSFPFHHLL